MPTEKLRLCNWFNFFLCFFPFFCLCLCFVVAVVVVVVAIVVVVVVVVVVIVLEKERREEKKDKKNNLYINNPPPPLFIKRSKDCENIFSCLRPAGGVNHPDSDLAEVCKLSAKSMKRRQ